MSKAKATNPNPEPKKPYQPQRGVIVMAADEPAQQAVYERLKAGGFGPLRVVTA